MSASSAPVLAQALHQCWCNTCTSAGAIPAPVVVHEKNKNAKTKERKPSGWAVKNVEC